jgi:hypothetical protein
MGAVKAAVASAAEPMLEPEKWGSAGEEEGGPELEPESLLLQFPIFSSWSICKRKEEGEGNQRRGGGRIRRATSSFAQRGTCRGKPPACWRRQTPAAPRAR